VFQDDFARAFVESGADEIIVPDVFRASLPPDERLSIELLVKAVNAGGRRARHIPTADEIARTVADESRPGDVVVIMSNGGFDGLHDKLIGALEER
jgi:UDP-N-acetylmuramate: L-alanyl-gamma-D-glutamyl-meso-diaminopimelate ligase